MRNLQEEQLLNGLDGYPHIKKEDVLEAIQYVKAVLTNEEIIESTTA